MKNIIFTLTILLLFSGCAFHIKYHKGDFGTKGVTEPTITTDKLICIFYNQEDYIDLDVRHSLQFSNLAFDYGDALVKIGEKYFPTVENIRFLSIESNKTKNTKCDYKIYPKVEKAIYTYFNKRPTYMELNVTMTFKIEDSLKNITYDQVYESGTLTVPWTMISEYILISNIFSEWMKNQIVNVINELDKEKQ